VDQVLLTTCDLARSQLTRPLELQLPASAGEHSIEALAEADRLQQVILNLIENADKYSHPDQPIQVRLEEGDGDGLTITVSDRGIGIPPQDLPRIFDRFYRAANTAEQKHGSGLGLSVVKLLVEAMGGSIGVESQLGEGSRFRVHLPALRSGKRRPDAPIPA
jgi:two-component system OmpR family sensor kinase